MKGEPINRFYNVKGKFTDNTKRWNEYVRKPIPDVKDKPTKLEHTEGPDILTSEIISTLEKIDKNKEQGQIGIISEMLSSLGNFRIEKIAEIINEIYDHGDVPQDPTKYIFLTLPKEPDVKECRLHRTVS